MVDSTGEFRPRKLIPWVVGFVALAVLLYSALGIGMVGSMAPDPPTKQWTIAAYLYMATFVISLLVLTASVIVLVRRRRRDRSSPGAAAV
jgi:heme/copper-type cytochrome/quinol oxidase subunit 2